MLPRKGGWAAGPEQLQLPGRVGHLVLDLLIAAVALHHNAEPVSFNADFEAIALVSALRITRGFGKGRWAAGDRR